MQLYLSNSRPWRTDYCTEDGVVLYKADAPRFSWGGETISITKLQPSAGNYQHNYAQLAEIEYHSGGLFSQDSRIKIGNRNLAAKEVLMKGHTKFWTSGYGERIFAGPDGKMYVWKMGSDKCRLFLKDTEILIATFHRKHLGVLSDARAASLEIVPQGQHMMDDILTTFIYMERLRTQKAQARNAAASSAGAAGGGGGGGC
ncbi:hypothetical protein CPB83DRAFT_864734 [Crepidotus variabilis]|uniref:DUF6593 domain-containing protein n=1 Tax=Crepidotus variabilis TaxID=179855 RepID=A0A9P6JID5_9AGAR|nr:hypothetical protein CPB83DRAFT_864734 [Crepidotus variabilis]